MAFHYVWSHSLQLEQMSLFWQNPNRITDRLRSILAQVMACCLSSVQCSIQSAFCMIHTLKIPMTPKTESRESKMTLCHFCGNLNFWSPQAKRYFSWCWLSRAVKISVKDQIKTHLLHSILICIYSVRFSAQHYKQSNTLIFPLHHCIAWLNTTM